MLLKKQRYGIESKENLSSLIENQFVFVKIIDIDRYGRVSGYVYINGKNINLEQVKSGYAWTYT